VRYFEASTVARRLSRQLKSRYRIVGEALQPQGVEQHRNAGQRHREAQDVAGVSKVDVRLRQGEAVVQHDADTSVESLVKALPDAGYEGTSLAA
jgi:hypothetical protein